ncbi:MAG: hypothetical protein C0404_09290 [Verrucomicrobia bacterium]|nr:hypothetical protein [Verrucomicrobiota bacterium]
MKSRIPRMFQWPGRMPDLPPLTLRGRALLAIGVAALGYGLLFADGAVTRISLSVLFILLIARVLSFLNMKDVVCRKDMPSMVCQGERFGITMSVQNNKAAMHSFDILAVDHFGERGRRESFLFAGVAPSTWKSTVKTGGINRRGVFGPSEYVLSSSFPFGLVGNRMTGMLTDTLSVYPAPRLPFNVRNLLETGTSQGNYQHVPSPDITTEFRSMREYRAGDHKKLISWPVSIRLQELVVKEMEAPCPSEVLIIYHNYHPARTILTPRSFERSLRLLSGLAWHFHDNTTPFSFVSPFNNWHKISVPAGSANFDDFLRTLAVARMTPSDSMEVVAELVRKESDLPQAIMVVSNTPVNYWRELIPNVPAPVICIDNRNVWIGTGGEQLCAHQAC